MSELGQDALVSLELVPREAFREAIANALVHRCLDVNASINVRMFPDRIEVTSPGGLPDGMSKDKTVRILNALIEKRLIEKSGSGRSTRYSRL